MDGIMLEVETGHDFRSPPVRFFKSRRR